MKELLAKHERRYIHKQNRGSKIIENENGDFLIFTGNRQEAEEIYIVISTIVGSGRDFFIQKGLAKVEKETSNVYEYRFDKARDPLSKPRKRLHM
jgi:hypothetical protein